MGSASRLAAWCIAAVLVAVIATCSVAAVRDAAIDIKKQDCHRLARAEAQVEGSDGREVQAACDVHASFFARPGTVNASQFS